MTEVQARPGVIRRTRALLFVSLGVWLFGAISGGMHLSRGLGAGEGTIELRSDLWFLTQRLLLFIASAVGLVAVSRRRSLGRWVAIGLGVVLLLQAWPSVAYGWRAVRGDLAPSPGLLAYSSTEDAFIGTSVAVAIMLAVATVALELACGSDAKRYFISGRNGDPGE